MHSCIRVADREGTGAIHPPVVVVTDADDVALGHHCCVTGPKLLRAPSAPVIGHEIDTFPRRIRQSIRPWRRVACGRGRFPH